MACETKSFQLKDSLYRVILGLHQQMGLAQMLSCDLSVTHQLKDAVQSCRNSKFQGCFREHCPGLKELLQ